MLPGVHSGGLHSRAAGSHEGMRLGGSSPACVSVPSTQHRPRIRGKCTTDLGTRGDGRPAPKTVELEQAGESPGLQDTRSAKGPETSSTQRFSAHFCLRPEACKGPLFLLAPLSSGTLGLQASALACQVLTIGTSHRNTTRVKFSNPKPRSCFLKQSKSEKLHWNGTWLI